MCLGFGDRRVSAPLNLVRQLDKLKLLDPRREFNAGFVHGRRVLSWGRAAKQHYPSVSCQPCTRHDIDSKCLGRPPLRGLVGDHTCRACLCEKKNTKHKAGRRPSAHVCHAISCDVALSRCVSCAMPCLAESCGTVCACMCMYVCFRSGGERAPAAAPVTHAARQASWRTAARAAAAAAARSHSSRSVRITTSVCRASASPARHLARMAWFARCAAAQHAKPQTRSLSRAPCGGGGQAYSSDNRQAFG